jgi:hypothetical protein
MIDFKDYDLVFWNKEDESRWIGKRIIPGSYVVYNPITTEKLRLNSKKLKALFESDEGNSKLRIKKFKRIA